MKFLKSRKVQTIFLISFAIIADLIFALIYHCINNTIPFPEVLYYFSQIICSIFVISGVVIAVWQYYLSSKSAKTDLEIQQVQRAIDLSEYYKDNILKYSSAIEYVFKKSGILSIINTIKLEQLNDFDKYELNDLFTADQVQQLRDFQNSDSFIEAVIEANAIYNLDLKFQTEKTEINKDNQHAFIVALNCSSVVVAFLSNLVTNVLNNMEYFALHFSHKTADESVVYQSLHQSYFRLIKYMYYYIAKQNENPLDKYYTNTIKLFIEWRDEKNIQKENRSAKSETIPRKGTVIEK